MNHKEYAEKLRGFNKTVKYLEEMTYMFKRMEIQVTEKILDYGCGVGTMIEELKRRGHNSIWGYDRFIYMDEQPDWFKHELWWPIDKVYFMHSLAHIEDPAFTIRLLRDEALTGSADIYVMTPNKDWMEAYGKDKNWKPDPTVVEHFTMETLKALFTDQGFRIKEINEHGEFYEGHGERLFLHARK